MDETSMILGWLVGRRIAGQRGRQHEQMKEPIAYLYDGIWMPPIYNRYNEEEYPYAILAPGEELAGSYYCFALSKSPFTAYQKDGSAFIDRVGDQPLAWVNREGSTDWTTMNPVNISYTIPVDSVVWTNHDICNEDNAIFMPKSNDPIPVYDP